MTLGVTSFHPSQREFQLYNYVQFCLRAKLKSPPLKMANLVVYKVKLYRLKKKKEGIEEAIEYYEEKLEEARKKSREESKRRRILKRQYGPQNTRHHNRS